MVPVNWLGLWTIITNKNKMLMSSPVHTNGTKIKAEDLEADILKTLSTWSRRSARTVQTLVQAILYIVWTNPLIIRMSL